MFGWNFGGSGVNLGVNEGTQDRLYLSIAMDPVSLMSLLMLIMKKNRNSERTASLTVH